MPIPKPTTKETEEEFISRCMGNDLMNDEYPDNKQRYAVCQSQWDKDKEKKTMKTEREIRTFELDTIEIRADDDKEKIRGHAAVFNKLSEEMFGFREIIMPGAFTEAILKDDIRALFNHDPNYVLGRNKSGTLKLEEDEKGLAIEIDPPDTQWARDLMVSIKRGDISQMSFAFNIRSKKGEEWDQQEGKIPIRKLINTKLYDISPVTYPAYLQTDVKVRSAFEKAGLDAERLITVMEMQRAITNEDITVVREAIDILNSYLPNKAEDLGVQGAHDNDGYVERLNMERWRMEFDSI